MYATPPTNVKLYSCLDHDLTMCMLFGYNRRIIFCHFFHKMNLVIFPAKVNTMYLVYAAPPTVLLRSFETKCV